MLQQAMRVFSTEFKQGVVLRLEAGERIAAVADELKIKRKLLYEWRILIYPFDSALAQSQMRKLN